MDDYHYEETKSPMYKKYKFKERSSSRGKTNGLRGIKLKLNISKTTVVQLDRYSSIKEKNEIKKSMFTSLANRKRFLYRFKCYELYLQLEGFDEKEER